MKAEDTPQIIEKAFVSIDTSKLAQLKSGSFWKEQFCAALNLIPCVGGALAQEIQTIGNYKDAELFRKLYVYIYNLADYHVILSALPHNKLCGCLSTERVDFEEIVANYPKYDSKRNL